MFFWELTINLKFDFAISGSSRYPWRNRSSWNERRAWRISDATWRNPYRLKGENGIPGPVGRAGQPGAVGPRGPKGYAGVPGERVRIPPPTHIA